jgi:hypothetical protein
VGSGFRTFTAGEVLTASNVQNYLQDQVVMTFAGSAARSSAIGTANFEEGMVSYLTDTDKVEAYNGTNWVQVGSSNQGLTLINTTSFSAVASQSFTSIFTSTYNNYRVVVNISAVSNNDGDQFIRVRSGSSDITSNYIYSSWVKTSAATDISYNSGGASYVKLGAQDGASAAAQAYSFDIIAPLLTVSTKILANVSMQNDAGLWAGGVVSGLNFNATSYDGFTLHTQNGTFTGTASVYGYNK